MGEKQYGISDHDVLLGTSALHHDMSVFDVLGTFVVGACLILPLESKRKEPVHWLELATRWGVTCWIAVPPAVEMLVETGTAAQIFLPNLRVVLSGGDWLSVTLSERLRLVAPNAQLWSIGGPTETTMWNIDNLVQQEKGWSSVPYGTPIQNCQYRILDSQYKDCPDWVVGEMYAGGVCLARGFLNNPNRTLQRFMQLPSGEIAYQTGDLGRFHPDGRIEFMGRKDLQVKVRGNRIDLGEIRSVCEKWPEVSQAIPFIYENKLAIALSAKPHKQLPSQEQCRTRAIQDLSSYMIPNIWLQPKAMPLTANNKIDIAACMSWLDMMK